MLMQAVMNLKADCCKLLLETAWAPILARACFWVMKLCSISRAAAQQHPRRLLLCCGSCCHSWCLGPCPWPLWQQLLPLQQWVCLWPQLLPLQLPGAAAVAAAVPHGEAVAQAKHGGKVKIWGINPCVCAQLALMLSSCALEQIEDQNSELAYVHPLFQLCITSKKTISCQAGQDKITLDIPV